MPIDNLPKLFCAALLSSLAVHSGTAIAAPQNGIGTYIGLITATENGSRSNGFSLGMDAQFAVNENWSLVPYLMISDEKDSSSRTVSDGMTGLQARRWFDNWFVGGHLFVHDRVFYGSGNVQSSAYGPAIGFVLGYENQNGWGAALQSDSFESTNTTGVRRNAFRLHMTYRWH